MNEYGPMNHPWMKGGKHNDYKHIPKIFKYIHPNLYPG